PPAACQVFPMSQTGVSLPPSSTATVELVSRLRCLVHRNALRLRIVVLLQALALAVSAPLAYLWLAFFLDTQVHLSLTGRVAASLGLLVGVGWGVVHLVRRWRRLQLTEDQVALTMERRTPGGVQNRLINAVQLARGKRGADPRMSAAVVEENVTVL